MRRPHRLPRHLARIAVSSLVALTLASTTVHAQGAIGPQRPITVIVSGGATVPVGGFKDYNDLGVHADVSLLVKLAGMGIRLRPEFSYGRFSLKDQVIPPQQAVNASSGALARTVSRSAIPNYGASDVSTLLGALGNIELPLAGGLYVLGGIGATSVKTGATLSASSNDVSQTAFTYTAGAGLRFKLGPMAGFVEGRLSSLSLDKGKAAFDNVSTIPVTFGIVF